MKSFFALVGMVVVCAHAAVVAAKENNAEQPAISHVSCSGGPNEVRIFVHNVKASVGLVIADLYKNDENGFLRTAGRVSQVRFAARAPITSFCMAAPIEDSFAVAVYHDKNANKTFDKNPFGLPAEPFGVSNNPSMRFAPPRLKDALFEVATDGATVDIELNN